MFGTRATLREARRRIASLENDNAKMIRLMTRLADNNNDMMRTMKVGASQLEVWSLRVIEAERENRDLKNLLAESRCLIDCQKLWLKHAGIDPDAILADPPELPAEVTAKDDDDGGKRICPRCNHEWMLLTGDYPADGICTVCRQAMDETEPEQT